MANMAKIEDKLKILPAMPGCYLMKNKDGDIIYVGKAKKLKQRVRQYFVGAHDFKTTRLVSNIDDFEYIVTSSEKEALLLEINLIKKHTPPYNTSCLWMINPSVSEAHKGKHQVKGSAT